jgi:hypothetical protein
MIRSVVMFAHVVGVLALFGALAVESVGWASVRRSMARAEALPFFSRNLAVQRVYGIALAVIVATGAYLGRQYGVLSAGWMLVSYGGLLLIAISAGMARGRVRLLRLALQDPSDPAFLALRSSANHLILRVSLNARIALALAIVYLMIAKPETGNAVGIIVLAVAVALVTSFAGSRVAPAAVGARLQ